ncbi:hypothetical protein BC739_003942 [Kutzneria viridogrisea]|uniref:Uncharacterized protein n=1 Tax=Kutzneria viridogrisea TaxID=47990 RepID=A0ABR6BJ62_9PSEU|nr:hypothetical protein [Kutzneria albida]MBA8926736.1 hypothetical protein [Kutzneria viridogrisea]
MIDISGRLAGPSVTRADLTGRAVRRGRILGGLINEYHLAA